MVNQISLWFSLQPLKLSPLVARVFYLFVSMPKTKLGKNRVQFLSLARLEPTTYQLPSQMHNQFNQIHNCDNSYNFRILLSRLAFKYIIKSNAQPIQPKTHNWHTQDLNPSPLTQSKYSQPLELVLFYVIVFCIKCLKGFYYPHLLNNYLINYLIFSGLTARKKNHFNWDGNFHSSFIMVCFSSPLGCLSKLGFLCLFTFMPKLILAKRKLNLDLPRFEPITMPMSNQCTTIQSCFVVILIILGLYYHAP